MPASRADTHTFVIIVFLRISHWTISKRLSLSNNNDVPLPERFCLLCVKLRIVAIPAAISEMSAFARQKPHLVAKLDFCKLDVHCVNYSKDNAHKHVSCFGSVIVSEVNVPLPI